MHKLTFILLILAFFESTFGSEIEIRTDILNCTNKIICKPYAHAEETGPKYWEYDSEEPRCVCSNSWNSSSENTNLILLIFLPLFNVFMKIN